MPYAAVTGLSHDGLVRDHNEDSLVAGPWTLCAATTLTPQTIYFPIDDPLVVAVADGLGGHPAGEQASSLAVQHMAWAGPSLTGEAAVRETIGACNELMYSEAARDPERIAMGTTIAGVVIIDSAVIVFNVGDSRVYRLDDTRLAQLSVDDNEPPSPGQHRSPVLTQCLGGRLDAEAIEPHLSTWPLAGPARYLICTDGLTDAVDDETITALLRSHDGSRAAFELWRAAIEAGAADNVTLALVEITQPAQ
ncbi:MAG: family protein phosphatase [Pseudonocardiales bacterium]|jgi:serine/threonine protein phosphatase PrpC|nr:protein serine/threonine phosphatase [Jatrophihabitans sp.]MDT4903206.1 family protein phosphatase [Pseudonocardiales bacterium]MDT4982004.1 family protein phosphatase [Pseudonocardiales bacterium]MDT4983109.1 family protein phosphatase [Pseudonocardiales bacterium]